MLVLLATYLVLAHSFNIFFSKQTSWFSFPVVFYHDLKIRRDKVTHRDNQYRRLMVDFHYLPTRKSDDVYLTWNDQNRILGYYIS